MRSWSVAVWASRAALAWAVGGVAVAVTTSGCSQAGPRVQITLPPDGARFTQGATIRFEGAGGGHISDPTGPPLPSSAWVWTSDRDGVLGEGPNLERNDLSIGAHVITLRVDAWRGPLEDEITIHVRAPPSAGRLWPRDGKWIGSVLALLRDGGMRGV
jgi:hypothetical protein